MKTCTECGTQLSGNQFKKHNGKCEKCRTPGPPKPKVDAVEEAEAVAAEAEAKVEAEAPGKEAEDGEDKEAAAVAGLSEEDRAILEAIKAMADGDARNKALARFARLKEQDDRSTQAKRFLDFDNELKEALPKWLAEMARKHNVSLVGRKVTIAFPKEGDPRHTNTPLGSRAGNSGGNGKGFTTHGKALYEGVEHNSLHALADHLNLQYEGRRTAFQVFEEPLEKGTKAELPYKFTVVKGEDSRLHVEKVAEELCKSK